MLFFRVKVETQKLRGKIANLPKGINVRTLNNLRRCVDSEKTPSGLDNPKLYIITLAEGVTTKNKKVTDRQG